MTDHTNVHATGLVIDGVGIMLRGPSGAGKSLLALQLMSEATRSGKQAALIADDRLDVIVKNDSLIAHAPAKIAGLIELRGRGIVSREHVQSASIHLVVDLVDRLDRLVEEEELKTEIDGVQLVRCPVPNRQVIDPAHQLLLIEEALRALKKTA